MPPLPPRYSRIKGCTFPIERKLCSGTGTPRFRSEVSCPKMRRGILVP